MDKIYPDRLEFVNGSVPALNDTNLNKMSKALDDLDDRVIEVSGDIMTVVPEVREMLEEADALVESARVSASNASVSEINAERYAQEAASGSGGNNLDYKDEMLQLKRDEVVLSAVHISGGGGGSADTSVIDGNFAWGGANLLKPTLNGSTTTNGITCTYNEADGTYTLNGTASADINSLWIVDSIKLKANTYKIIGVQNPSSNCTVQLYRRDDSTRYGTPNAYDYRDNGISTLVEGTYNVRLFIKSGQTFSNVVIKPMLTTDLTRTYDTFVPFGKTNVELTKSVDDAVERGYYSKNLLQNIAKSQTLNGITFTVNDDGTVLANGTATSSFGVDLNTLYFKANTEIILSCGYVRGTASAMLSIIYKDGGSSVLSTNIPTGKSELKVTIPKDGYYRILIWHNINYTSNNILFKPMIRMANVTDDTYEPYTPSNTELSQATTNIMGSDAYNPSTSYAENDTCIDENTLWKCLVACSGIKPSTDDGTHWEKVTLSQINNDLSAKSRAFEITTARYRPASDTSVAANGTASVIFNTLVSGSTGNVLLGVMPYTGNGNLAIYSTSWNALSVRNLSSSAKSLPTAAYIDSIWLKWL